MWEHCLVLNGILRGPDSVYFEIGSGVNSTETEGSTLATEKPSAKSDKL